MFVVPFTMRRMLLLAVFLISGSVMTHGQDKHDAAATGNFRVVFFISPTCKICQYYTLPFREFHENYSSKGFAFEALVPGSFFTDEDITNFSKKYRIPFPVRRDTELLHVKWMATITPEVFVIDSLGSIVYHGRIDDSYAAIGKRRRVVNNHELISVLDAIADHRQPPFQFVQAVGCLIEKD